MLLKDAASRINAEPEQLPFIIAKLKKEN